MISTIFLYGRTLSQDQEDGDQDKQLHILYLCLFESKQPRLSSIRQQYIIEKELLSLAHEESVVLTDIPLSSQMLLIALSPK
jgi:hypothetical protein